VLSAAGKLYKKRYGERLELLLVGDSMAAESSALGGRSSSPTPTSVQPGVPVGHHAPRKL
jgi:hypothetical protein